MRSKLYELLPEHITREIDKHIPRGGRFCVTPSSSHANPNFIKDRNKDICKRFNETKDVKTVAQEFGLSERWTRAILTDNGIVIRNNKKISLIEEIKILLGLGYKEPKIAKKLGKSRQWIYHIVKKEGLK